MRVIVFVVEVQSFWHMRNLPDSLSMNLCHVHHTGRVLAPKFGKFF